MRRSWWVLVGAAALVAGCSSGSVDPAATVTPSAEPTPSSATSCTSGAEDQPGDPSRPRPALIAGYQLAAADPTGPRIVVGESGFVPEGSGLPSLQSTWTFDVCTNAWAELGDASLPAPEQRPALGQFVADPTAGAVLGLPGGLTPVWSFDPARGAWSSTFATGGGSEAGPAAVFDPQGGQVLAFDPNLATDRPASGVLAFDAGARAWTALDLADPEAAVPTVVMDQYDVAYDSGAQRLILVVTSWDAGRGRGRGQVWAFDPAARTWTRGADVPRTLANGYHAAGWAVAFDPTTARTWLFADTAMLGYDARADSWVVAQRDAGWPTSMTVAGVEVDPVARIVDGMVADPANGRLVVIGGGVRPVGDPVGGFVEQGSLRATDDVWAYEPATNTWTMLLAPSQAPASFGPG